MRKKGSDYDARYGSDSKKPKRKTKKYAGGGKVKAEMRGTGAATSGKTYRGLA